MKILFLCHRFPGPPLDGARVRAYHMIEYLSKRHEVTVATLAETKAELAQSLFPDRKVQTLVTLLPLWKRKLKAWGALLSQTPSSFAYFYDPALQEKIDQAIDKQRFDWIVVHCSSMAPYVKDVKGTRKVLDFCDMDSQKWLDYAKWFLPPKAWGYAWEGRKLLRQEKSLVSKFDACTVATPGELLDLWKHCGKTGRADWFANGVDTEYFTPQKEDYDINSLCFLGRMDYYPNQQAVEYFCDYMWSRLKRQMPHLRLFIVGANPSAKIRRLAEKDGIIVTGTVPDVRPYLRRSLAMVAPMLIARGTQNKLLEAMASGVPVVASPLAAMGIDAQVGKHILVPRDADQWLDYIFMLQTKPAYRRQLSQAGRARVLAVHRWEDVMKRFGFVMRGGMIGPIEAGLRALSGQKKKIG